MAAVEFSFSADEKEFGNNVERIYDLIANFILEIETKRKQVPKAVVASTAPAENTENTENTENAENAENDEDGTTDASAAGGFLNRLSESVDVFDRFADTIQTKLKLNHTLLFNLITTYEKSNTQENMNAILNEQTRIIDTARQIIIDATNTDDRKQQLLKLFLRKVNDVNTKINEQNLAGLADVGTFRKVDEDYTGDVMLLKIMNEDLKKIYPKNNEVKNILDNLMTSTTKVLTNGKMVTGFSGSLMTNPSIAPYGFGQNPQQTSSNVTNTSRTYANKIDKEVYERFKKIGAGYGVLGKEHYGGGLILRGGVPTGNVCLKFDFLKCSENLEELQGKKIDELWKHVVTTKYPRGDSGKTGSEVVKEFLDETFDKTAKGFDIDLLTNSDKTELEKLLKATNPQVFINMLSHLHFERNQPRRYEHMNVDVNVYENVEQWKERHEKSNNVDTKKFVEAIESHDNMKTLLNYWVEWLNGLPRVIVPGYEAHLEKITNNTTGTGLGNDRSPYNDIVTLRIHGHPNAKLILNAKQQLTDMIRIVRVIKNQNNQHGNGPTSSAKRFTRFLQNGGRNTYSLQQLDIRRDNTTDIIYDFIKNSIQFYEILNKTVDPATQKHLKDLFEKKFKTCADDLNKVTKRLINYQQIENKTGFAVNNYKPGDADNGLENDQKYKEVMEAYSLLLEKHNKNIDTSTKVFEKLIKPLQEYLNKFDGNNVGEMANYKLTKIN